MPITLRSALATTKLATRAAIAGAVAIPVAAWGFARHQNSALVLTEVDVAIPGLPRELEGFRIAHVSDLHDASFGKGQSRLAGMVESCSPDLIALTGDMIEGEGISNALALARRCVALAPTVSVTGNHESYSTRASEFLRRMADIGIRCLCDESVDGSWVAYGGSDADAFSQLTIVGLQDPSFGAWDERAYPEGMAEARLSGIASRPDWPGAHHGARILLAHRPELLPSYANPAFGIDLVLAGHAHGGQWRLPVVGGLYAPSQGVLPKWTSGVHRVGHTQMVVSRGLGNSGFPLRLNNRPEVVAVTLRQAAGALPAGAGA